MASCFKARISQEHSSNVRNIALSMNVPQESITFEKGNCPLGSLRVSIEFKDKDSLTEFRKRIMQSCILEDL